MSAWCAVFHAKESYILQGLLSYARRYWRKSLSRSSKTDVALQLKAVLKPNPQRHRESCRKKKAVKGGMDTCVFFMHAGS